jgi:hypothetical protein
LINSERVRLESLSGVNLNVRNIAALEIPATTFGADGLKPGDALALEVSLVTHGRAYTIEWTGQFRLRD